VQNFHFVKMHSVIGEVAALSPWGSGCPLPFESATVWNIWCASHSILMSIPTLANTFSPALILGESLLAAHGGERAMCLASMLRSFVAARHAISCYWRRQSLRTSCFSGCYSRMTSDDLTEAN